MKRKIYRYVVTGRGRFPVDMLRYDSCWPRDGMSAEAILEPRELRQVELLSHCEPTVGRWSSFLWGVEMINEN